MVQMTIAIRPTASVRMKRRGRGTQNSSHHSEADQYRTYAVGVLAGARGPQALENLLWRAKPSKPPNRVTPTIFVFTQMALPLVMGQQHLPMTSSWCEHRRE